MSTHRNIALYASCTERRNRSANIVKKVGTADATLRLMSNRTSIEVPGLEHVNPIPNASRLGPFLMSGGIFGKDPGTGKVPEGIEALRKGTADGWNARNGHRPHHHGGRRPCARRR